jgi:alkylated DNA repair dioxygenase AlkB
MVKLLLSGCERHIGAWRLGHESGGGLLSQLFVVIHASRPRTSADRPRTHRRLTRSPLPDANGRSVAWVIVSVHQPSLLDGGEPRVDPDARIERVALDDRSWVDIGRGFVLGADTLLDRLLERVEWHQGRRWMYERMVDDPRLSRHYAPDEAPPDAAIAGIGRALEAHYGVPFGGVGVNYYRDGRDSVAFHRDRELRRVDDGIVAIVTLGARRPFLVRRHEPPRGRSRDFSPARGDLLVMGGRCQADWEHGVPKVARAGPRVSLSWRWSRASA